MRRATREPPRPGPAPTDNCHWSLTGPAQPTEEYEPDPTAIIRALADGEFVHQIDFGFVSEFVHRPRHRRDRHRDRLVREHDLGIAAAAPRRVAAERGERGDDGAGGHGVNRPHAQCGAATCRPLEQLPQQAALGVDERLERLAGRRTDGYLPATEREDVGAEREDFQGRGHEAARRLEEGRW